MYYRTCHGRWHAGRCDLLHVLNFQLGSCIQTHSSAFPCLHDSATVTSLIYCNVPWWEVSHRALCSELRQRLPVRFRLLRVFFCRLGHIRPRWIPALLQALTVPLCILTHRASGTSQRYGTTDPVPLFLDGSPTDHEDTPARLVTSGARHNNCEIALLSGMSCSRSTLLRR